MENNDSRILRIPKEEFIKVMSEIVYGSPENDNGVTKEEATENDEVDDASEDRVLFYSSRTGPSTSRSSGSRYIVDDSPRTKITKSAQAAANEKKTRKMEGYVKSDSLYFLQRSIQAREKEWKSLLEDKRDVSHLRNRLYTSVTPRDSSQADFEYAVLEKKT